MTYTQKIFILDDIMMNFDFKKVHDIMQFLNWTWFNKNNTYTVPTIDEIRSSAKALCLECIDRHIDLRKDNPGIYSYAMGTGGLRVVTLYDEEDDNWNVELSFEAAQWNCDTSLQNE